MEETSTTEKTRNIATLRAGLSEHILMIQPAFFIFQNRKEDTHDQDQNQEYGP